MQVMRRPQGCVPVTFMPGGMLPSGHICVLARVALRGHVCACRTGEAKVKPTPSAARKTKERIAPTSNQMHEPKHRGGFNIKGRFASGLAAVGPRGTGRPSRESEGPGPVLVLQRK